jgi:hypothetical protein
MDVDVSKLERCAERCFTCVIEGESRQIVTRIYKPLAPTADAPFWRCCYQTVGVGPAAEYIGVALGYDGLDALLAALRSVAKDLHILAHSYGCALAWMGVDDIGFGEKLDAMNEAQQSIEEEGGKN